ncbi:MAG: beta-glucosidase [Proteobacteria bacterium]|nr:MAG: beta-glucosidase [Pseudomonadota bacterium]
MGAFRSTFLGGFECSSHRRADGVRLDLLAATRHDAFARRDYEELARHGVRSVRDGLRWHRIEASPGRCDWSSFLPMLRAAAATGTQVVWDLCHYGWPDHLDIASAAFPERFARFAAEAARIVRGETEEVPWYCPVNEVSYWAWAGGEVGRINPLDVGRGAELKRQLVRAFVAALDAIRQVDPRARFITAEPLIHLVSHADDPAEREAAERLRLAQFEAMDLLSGRLEPALGGASDCLDLVGVNFYPDNQWYLHGSTIPLGHHAYRPLAELLEEVYLRYGRPLLIAETGAEGSARPYWLHHVCAEVRAAAARGVPIEGICLYPVLDYPGWENGRTCRVGLLSMPDAAGRRSDCPALAEELARQHPLLQPAPRVRDRVVAYG